MSSRFLARGHNNRGMPLCAKAHGKEQGSHSSKPPVSKVRPLMDDNQSRNTEDKTPVSPGRIEGPHGLDAPDRDCGTLKKRKTSGTHLWRMSNPPSKAPPLLLDKAPCLQKSHSAQNLASESLRSPVPSSDRRELRKRPQQLLLDPDAPNPSFHFSSPSSGSPQSPDSPMPWESPKLRPHSYMNPTASSTAKSSRSTSLGDVVQLATPPRSPLYPRARRSCGELEVDPSVLASPPVPAFTASAVSISPTAAVSPSPLPSRIPLPKQPLSPRRSLCLEVTPSLSCPSRTPTGSSPPPAADDAPTPGSRALGRHRSLDHSFTSSLPVRQKRDSVSESAKDASQAAVAKECPLVPEQTRTSSVDPQPDLSITLETCRQAVTELHSSLRKTAMLYSTVLQGDQQLSEDQQEMRSILSEALCTVKAELDSLPHATAQCEGPRGDREVKGQGDKALALLEQYAELLLKSVERRLDTKT